MVHFGTFWLRTVVAVILVLQAFVPGIANAGQVLIPAGTPVEKINRAIANAESGSIFQFAPGTHSLRGRLTIARDDVSLTGFGRGRTFLRFSAESGDFVRIEGSKPAATSILAEPAERGQRTIVLAEPYFARPGDHVYLQQPNTPDWIAANGWHNVSFEEARDRPFRESIHTIESVDGHRLTLKTALPFGFSATETTIERRVLRKGVSISDLTITSNLGAAGPHDFTNPLPAFSRAAAIHAKGTAGLQLTDIAIENSPSRALVISGSIDADVARIHIDGAHNKGGGGNGYGVELHEAFGNRLSGLTILNMRHALIFSAWHAETGNLVHIERTNRDINFHGSIDHSNTVTVDELSLEYAPDRTSRKRKNVWRAVSPGGTNHAATDFLAVNRVRFGMARGSWREDSLMASDNGARLEGGLGRDVLRGGRGRDVFVFKAGDGDDVVEDFAPGPNGDTLRLELEQGVPAPAVERSGQDLKVRYPGGTITLKGLGGIDAAAAIRIEIPAPEGV